MSKHVLFALATAVATGGFVYLGVAASPTPPAPLVQQDDEDDKEVAITLEQAPEQVRRAIERVLAGNKLQNLTREVDEGFTLYEATFEAGGSTHDVTFAASGDVMEVERTVEPSALPAAAMEAIRKKYPQGRLAKVETVQLNYFAVLVEENGKKHEADVFATGKLREEEPSR